MQNENITTENTSTETANVAPVTTESKPAAKRTAKPKADKPAKQRAKPAAKREAVTEAKPDPRAERAARIAADRGTVAKLYSGFEANRVSVPVKALSAFKPATTTAHPIARNPSIRQAAAIAAAFSASGVKLASGKPAPRVFDLNGVRSCIENGVLRDAVSSGLCRVTGDTPETEKLFVNAKQATAVLGLIGEKLAKAGGIA